MEQVEKNRQAFSHSNMVRMREAIRYFEPKHLEIFIKIPFLIHINVKGHPGFVDSTVSPNGIWGFETSGFFKEAVKLQIFPKSVIETLDIRNPAVLGVYHIGSLGTFTQSPESDFDYWIIIDKKNFSAKRYDHLEQKLGGIIKYSREHYRQDVHFYIMDHRDLCHDNYASFNGEEILSASKVFLKEEFYRTFLMVAGKIPLWAVIPELPGDAPINKTALRSHIMTFHDDILDLGDIDILPDQDIFKGLLWHICKSKEDPIKALIKATMIFSYGFGRKISRQLLCERVKKGYDTAGIDDYEADPYQIMFDRILEFHELEDPKYQNLIKNAIFFRLCEYPNVKIPAEKTPKRLLLNHYIRQWKLNKKQVSKLLAYTTWSESEKLLLEKTILHRLAQMYNVVVKSLDTFQNETLAASEKTNWAVLINKTRERLNKSPEKIGECSTYIRRTRFSLFKIVETKGSWRLDLLTASGCPLEAVYTNSCFLGILGWILENQLYRRQDASIDLHASVQLFESMEKPITMDQLYLSFVPLKPFDDKVFAADPNWVKAVVVLFMNNHSINPEPEKAEIMVSNTWGEVFLETIEFNPDLSRMNQCDLVIKHIKKYTDRQLRLFVYQLAASFDPDIVSQIKTRYNDLVRKMEKAGPIQKKPYLDRL